MLTVTLNLARRGSVALPTAAAAVVIVATVVAGGALSPGHSPVGDTMSQLTDPEEPYRLIVRAGVAAYMLLLVPLALAVPRLFPDAVPSAVVRTGLLIYIGSGLVAAAFANDSPQALWGRITVDSVHDNAALTMFAAAILTVGGASLPAFGTTGEDGHAAVGAAWAARACFVFILAMGIVLRSGWADDFAGLMERAGLGLFVAWTVFAALRGRKSANAAVDPGPPRR